VLIDVWPFAGMFSDDFSWNMDWALLQIVYPACLAGGRVHVGRAVLSYLDLRIRHEAGVELLVRAGPAAGDQDGVTDLNYKSVDLDRRGTGAVPAGSAAGWRNPKRGRQDHRGGQGRLTSAGRFPGTTAARRRAAAPRLPRGAPIQNRDSNWTNSPALTIAAAGSFGFGPLLQGGLDRAHRSAGGDCGAHARRS
jgi:hypothetical protein